MAYTPAIRTATSLAPSCAGRGTEPFDKPALLDVTLAPVGHDQGHDAADTGHDGERQLGDIDRLRCRVVGGDELVQRPLRGHRDNETGAERGEDRGKQPDLAQETPYRLTRPGELERTG